MRTNSFVWTRVQVPGFHSWPEAFDEVAFLRDEHRHMFWIEVGYEVSHNDRALEFFILQRELLKRLDVKYRRGPGGEFDFGHRSCETIATTLIHDLNADWVTVSEDNENGATVRKDVSI